MTTTTDDRFRALAVPLQQTSNDLGTADWASDSPCEGWTATDVVSHIIDTQRGFMDERRIDIGERPNLGADPAAALDTHFAAMTDALADPAVSDMTFDGFFGPTTVGDALLTFYGFDMVVHRWDLAAAMGQAATFEEAEMDLIETAIDGFGEHLYMEGICKPAVEVPADASRQDRLLGRMGRTAGVPVRNM